jgi:hypothetical protein
VRRSRVLVLFVIKGTKNSCCKLPSIAVVSINGMDGSEGSDGVNKTHCKQGKARKDWRLETKVLR